MNLTETVEGAKEKDDGEGASPPHRLGAHHQNMKKRFYSLTIQKRINHF